jgi:hypothetical protein
MRPSAIMRRTVRGEILQIAASSATVNNRSPGAGRLLPPLHLRILFDFITSLFGWLFDVPWAINGF